MFADKICQLCASDLTVFASLRQDLVSKQKNLYELAGIDEAFITQQCDETEAEYAQDSCSDFGMEFETVEQDDVTTVYIEEQFPDEQDEAEATGTLIKIEKVGVKTNAINMDVEQDESTSFDLFEEIVGSVESDDPQSQGFDNESMKQEQEM